MPPRDLVLVLLVCLTWAGNFLTSALALREIPPVLFTALRFALLAGPMLFFLKRPTPGQWPRLVAVCLLVGVLHFATSFTALKLAGDLSSPAIVLQSYVPMTALLAWLMLGERFAWRTGLAIAISFAGVLVLGLDPMVLDHPMALGMMVVSAFFLALGTVLMKGLRGLDAYSQQGWTALISVLPLLAALKERHHWLTVATGKSRRGLDETLRSVELHGVFDGSRTADETAGKPSPLMLHELMREFGVDPGRTLMIGDTTHDLQMAVNAGCASVGVSYGAHEHDTFRSLRPRFVAHSVRELHDWLLDNA